jgi:hypothetical protein
MCGSSCSANFHLFKKIELLCTKVSIFAIKKKEHIIVTSEVFFDGTTEADGDDEAAVGLFGGRAEVFCGEEFFGGFRY